MVHTADADEAPECVTYAVWNEMTPTFDSVRERLTLYPLLSAFALRCTDDRLPEAGLLLSADQRELTRTIARTALKQLVGDAERLEEIEYPRNKLQAIWTQTEKAWRRSLRVNYAELQKWSQNYREYLKSENAMTLVTELLRLRADPAYMRGTFASDLRASLATKTSECLVQLFQRESPVPTDEFDRFAYSLHMDAGTPCDSLLEYVADRASWKVIEEIERTVGKDSRDKLRQFSSQCRPVLYRRP